jgi:hypothetical protein
VSTSTAGAPVVRLGPGARRRRLVATGAVAAVLLAGTAVGSDDWFPLGPFRMYTNPARDHGIVRIVRVETVDRSGATVRVKPDDVGLRHAELEAQMHRFRADPTLLGAVAEAYASRRPERPALVEVRLQEEIRQVVDRVVLDEVQRRTAATWRAGGDA